MASDDGSDVPYVGTSALHALHPTSNMMHSPPEPQALHTNDERKVLDVIDKLRRSGLNGTVELPQLVVCGDQSSGKSSVLEAITEIPFPRKESLCTRFATEIVLRRSTRSTISVRITPDRGRPESEKCKLQGFSVALNDFKGLPQVIDEAAEAMGLGKGGGTKRRVRNVFSKDVLSIEIRGPDRPQLTLINLPGLIHTTEMDKSKNDKKLVFDLVHEYMNNRRTIILAIVSVKNDWQNQIILDDCLKADKGGCRTLGIVTKPDTIAKSDRANWMELVQNKHIFLERGWHILKNRGPDETRISFTERKKAELRFFSQEPFCNLCSDHVGVDALRERLSSLLLDHRIQELPAVKEEICEKLEATSAILNEMGEKRTTLGEQRMALVKMSLQIQNILKAAVIGYYENPFFGAPKMDAGVAAEENINRFRAAVQHLNLQFSITMRQQGHKLTVACDPGDDDVEVAEAEEDKKALAAMSEKEFGSQLPKPKAIARDAAICWVQQVLERSRGFELPGTFNPGLISQLFWTQSEP